MKLTSIAESSIPTPDPKNPTIPTIIEYYKVLEEKPTQSKIIPGYLTKSHDIVSGYLSAFLDTKKENKIAYVIKTLIDVNQLKTFNGLVFGYNQDKTILPGYKGNQIEPDEGINDELDVIIWNEPIKIEIVGAYIPTLNVDHTKDYNDGHYIENGNAWRDSKNGIYTFDDLKQQSPHTTPPSRQQSPHTTPPSR